MIWTIVAAILIVVGVIAVILYLVEQVKKFIAWAVAQPTNLITSLINWIKNSKQRRINSKEEKLLWDGVKEDLIANAKRSNLENTDALKKFYAKRNYKNSKRK